MDIRLMELQGEILELMEIDITQSDLQGCILATLLQAYKLGKETHQ